MRFGQAFSNTFPGLLGIAETGHTIHGVNSQAPPDLEAFMAYPRATYGQGQGTSCQLKTDGDWIDFACYTDATAFLYDDHEHTPWLGRVLGDGDLLGNEWLHDPANVDPRVALADDDIERMIVGALR